jgi:hypothetical protein
VSPNAGESNEAWLAMQRLSTNAPCELVAISIKDDGAKALKSINLKLND